VRLGCRRATVGEGDQFDGGGGERVYGTDHVFGFFGEEGDCAGAVALDVLPDESHFRRDMSFLQGIKVVDMCVMISWDLAVLA